jgi:anti-anti-sigma factor
VGDLGAVSVDEHDHIVVARITGEVDLSNCKQIQDTLESSVNTDHAALVLDLGATTYFDSAGVRLVFQLAERLRARRQALAVVLGDNEIIQRVAELTSIADHVPCHSTVDAALASLSSS